MSSFISQGSPFMPNIEQKIRPNNSQSDKLGVIWEINLRDSWDAILRALLTRALNLRPIAVHKSSIIYD
jgi:hypothetical protein